jgi:hypothetical protein
MPEKNNKILKLSWQQVVSAVVVMLFVGAISWMGATLKSKMSKIDDLERRLILIESFQSGEYQKDLEHVKERLQEVNLQMGSYGANQKRIEIVVGKLEALVERLEESIR